MTANVRRWQETTTGRKEEPIVAETPAKKKRDDKGRYIKKKEPESLEEALTEN
tara:strand:- start:72 stop:230 length:159 start_codon:yes stop_codon:yes gene_type:complete